MGGAEVLQFLAHGNNYANIAKEPGDVEVLEVLVVDKLGVHDLGAVAGFVGDENLMVEGRGGGVQHVDAPLGPGVRVRLVEDTEISVEHRAGWQFHAQDLVVEVAGFELVLTRDELEAVLFGPLQISE